MDTSKQLENLAGTEFAGSAVCERQKKRIVKLFKEEGISVLEFYRTSNRNGYLEIGMVVKSENRCYYDVMEIAIFCRKSRINRCCPWEDMLISTVNP